LAYLLVINTIFNILSYRNRILRLKIHVLATKFEQESRIIGKWKFSHIKFKIPKKRDKLVVFQHDLSNRRGKTREVRFSRQNLGFIESLAHTFQHNLT
jgi:hypothetical protein